MNYNGKIARRWNKWFRNCFILPKRRKRLLDKDITILANNCNAGFIYHDLGLQFKSPTINLFFYKDHFFTFLEHLDEYLAEEIRECKSPQHIPEINYPVCNLGSGDLPVIELHFNHYPNFQEAHDIWEKRKKRIVRDKVYAIFAFTDDTDEEWVKRFDRIPLKNKVALVNRPFPQYKSAYYIHGHEEAGLGMAGSYDNLLGRRIYDHFDVVGWLNAR